MLFYDIALTKNSENNYDIDFNNGDVILEESSYSITKHCMFCYGRVDRNMQPIRNRRRGFIGDVMNNSLSFSKAWYYYVQNIITQQNLLLIKDSLFTALNANSEINRLKNLGNKIDVAVKKDASNKFGVQVSVTIGNNKIDI